MECPWKMVLHPYCTLAGLACGLRGQFEGQFRVRQFRLFVSSAPESVKVIRGAGRRAARTAAWRRRQGGVHGGQRLLVHVDVHVGEVHDFEARVKTLEARLLERLLERDEIWREDLASSQQSDEQPSLKGKTWSVGDIWSGLERLGMCLGH